MTSQQPELLDNTEQGDWGLRENLFDMTYRLDDKKAALVHVRTIQCICFDLKVLKKKGKNEKRNIYKVSLEQHEEIMSNL